MTKRLTKRAMKRAAAAASVPTQSVAVVGGDQPLDVKKFRYIEVSTQQVWESYDKALAQQNADDLISVCVGHLRKLGFDPGKAYQDLENIRITADRLEELLDKAFPDGWSEDGPQSLDAETQDELNSVVAEQRTNALRDDALFRLNRQRKKDGLPVLDELPADFVVTDPKAESAADDEESGGAIPETPTPEEPAGKAPVTRPPRSGEDERKTKNEKK